MTDFQAVDRVLRGPTADPAAIPPAAAPLARAGLVLAAGYGACIGLYGLFRADGVEVRQVASSAVKVPALFALTAGVTLPSLYVFNTLLGSRLRPADLLRAVAAGLGVTAAVLAAVGPVVAFFLVSTASYPFAVVMNVAAVGLAGGCGMLALRRAFADPSAAGRPVAAVLYGWMAMFGLVGGQMGWLLRPFVGSPHLPFAWLRPRQGSFVSGVWAAVTGLLP